MPSFYATITLLIASVAGCARGPNQQGDNSNARGTVGVAKASSWPTPELPTTGKFEVVATDDGPVWTGVTVAPDGRIFVCFPRWGDNVEFTVGELIGEKLVAYPDAGINHLETSQPADHLVSVQSVVLDPADRLWALDSGSIRMRAPPPGGAKLVAIDLGSNRVVKSIVLPPDVALPTTYLNDVRFNLRQGKAGMAYITDSGDQGPNGIIVVDLDSQKSWRKLTGHLSVRPQPGFTATVEGRPLVLRPSPGVVKPVTVGTDGIAISADGKTLFYSPMSSRHLYGVSTEALADPSLSDDAVAESVVDYGDRGYASDGLESDSAGRLYLTDYEHNAVHRRTFGPAGPSDVTDEILARGPKLVWPDTLSVASDGYLYFTASQLCRQKQYNEGADLRQRPFLLFRTRIDAQPVQLK